MRAFAEADSPFACRRARRAQSKRGGERRERNLSVSRARRRAGTGRHHHDNWLRPHAETNRKTLHQPIGGDMNTYLRVRAELFTDSVRFGAGISATITCCPSSIPPWGPMLRGDGIRLDSDESPSGRPGWGVLPHFRVLLWAGDLCLSPSHCWLVGPYCGA